jgi:hypothetical protein
LNSIKTIEQNIIKRKPINLKPTDMPKMILKESGQKMRTSLSRKTKAAGSKKNSDLMYVSSKKNTGKLVHILNYQYQDSDLEQFVF